MVTWNILSAINIHIRIDSYRKSMDSMIFLIICTHSRSHPNLSPLISTSRWPTHGKPWFRESLKGPAPSSLGWFQRTATSSDPHLSLLSEIWVIQNRANVSVKIWRTQTSSLCTEWQSKPWVAFIPFYSVTSSAARSYLQQCAHWLHQWPAAPSGLPL